MKLLSDLSAQWAVIDRLLDEALTLDPSEHEAWLGRLAPEHRALEDTLRRLLAARVGDGSQPFLDTLPRITEPATDLKPGDDIGPYRLLERIGSGGQGSVWSAQRADGQLKRKLALKLPRLAWAEGLAARMERERDILGALDHPYIARLYDAGVDGRGRPFLAIEHVEGVSLDSYCDGQRLDLRARVVLFMRILEAVEYAHTALVVHRDLKPENVLVNARGEPKLLDFGVSSLMEQAGAEGEEAAAQTSTRAMTPRYASPEQMEGRRLGVGSDVYSLGVMLYELLSGCSPYAIKRGSVAEYERAILGEDRRPPSRAQFTEAIASARGTMPRRLARQLQGDLDAIVLRALARDPRERYGTTSALHDDLRRWLTGRPVQARPPSPWISLQKFLLRNRWVAGGVTLAVTAIAVAGLVAVQQARVAAEQARRANATRDFVMDVFSDANPALHGGRDLTARELLAGNEDRLVDRLGGDPALQADVLHSVAEVWDRFGDLPRVVDIHGKRAELLRATGASRGQVALALLEQGQALSVVRDYGRLAPLLARVDAMLPVSEMPPEVRERYEWQRGWLALESGQREVARGHFSRALGAARLTGNADLQVRALYGRSAVETASNRMVMDRDRKAALRDHAEALRLIDTAGLDRLDRFDRRDELVVNLFWLGEYRQGWPLQQLQMAEADQLFGEFSPIAVSTNLMRLAYLWRLGRSQEALDWLAARERRRTARGAAAEPRGIRESVIEARLWLAVGDARRARAVLAEVRGKMDGPDDGDAFRLGVVELEIEQQSSSPQSVLRALELPPWSGLSPDADSEWPLYPLWHRAIALERRGDQADALPLFGSALRVARLVFGEGHPRTALVALSLSFARWRAGGAGSAVAARAILERVMPDLERGFPEEHPARREAEAFLAYLRGAAASDEDLSRWRNPGATIQF